MAYTIKHINADSVLLFQAHADFDRATDMEPAIREVLSLLEGVTQPVFHILDWTDSKPSFADVAEGANTSARGENPVFHHPMVREVIFVTVDRMMRHAAKNMQSDTYGNTTISIFDTLDDALKYVRTRS